MCRSLSVVCAPLRRAERTVPDEPPRFCPDRVRRVGPRLYRDGDGVDLDRYLNVYQTVAWSVHYTSLVDRGVITHDVLRGDSSKY